MSDTSNLLSQIAQGIISGQIRVVDLTVPLEPATPVIQLPPQFAPSEPFTIQEISRYDERGPAWYWNNFSCGEHTGTHFDAPIHWVTGKDHLDNATDTIAPRKFIGPACVINVSAAVKKNVDYLLTVADLKAWESQYERIPRSSWVLIRTDWSHRESSSEFLNIGSNGPRTPGLHPDAARWLANERDILGVGVETVGTDAGQAAGFEPMFPCHTLMHGANRFGLASLTNLDQLPPLGALLIAPPLKIVNGSGSPLRVLALVPA